MADLAPHVVVVGAGIAGLSCAHALTRGGARVEILESVSELREVGAAISLWPNALAALGTIGLEQPVRDIGWPATGLRVRGPSGRDLIHLDQRQVRRILGDDGLIVHRADLLRVLSAATRDVPMRLGWNCAAVEDVGDGVVLRSQQGDEIRADIVIGCDGVHSVVRTAVPGQGAPTYQGVTTWRAVVSGDHHVEEPWLGIGDGKQIVASPLLDGRAYWSPMLRMEPGANAKLADPTGFLLRAFARWHQPIPHLINMTDPATLIRSDVYDRLPTRLAAGRVALAGDAAHSMNPAIGQGACQAIVDAAVLGAAWRRHPNALAALKAFERLRLDDVRRVVRQARRMNRICSSPSRIVNVLLQSAPTVLPSSLALSATARYGRRAVIGKYLEAAATR